jgi:hypothetical protein
MHGQMLQRLEKHVDKLAAVKLSFDVIMTDAKVLTHTLRFHHLVMRFLLRSATWDPSRNASWGKGLAFQLNGLALPLGQPPLAFRMLPEFMYVSIAYN